MSADKSLQHIPQFTTMPLAGEQGWSLVLKGPQGQLASLRIDGFVGGGNGGGGGGSGQGLIDYYIVEGTTTDDVEKEIFIEGIEGSRIQIAADSAVYYQADFVARTVGTGTDVAAWTLKGLANRNAGGTVDQGLIYEERIASTDPNFSVDVRANSVVNTINIYVQGAVGKTIAWRVHCSVLRTNQ